MRIVIVGGGCSGLLAAVHLLRNGFRDPLTIIEPRHHLGPGLAHSTQFDGHLLNVPARRMSGFTSDPDHFIDWLRTQNFPLTETNIYVPRKLYGEYLSGLLSAHDVRHLRTEVTAINATNSSAHLSLKDGSALEADKVILALGNPVSGASPWEDNALQLRNPGERILLLGAGQTAVDAVLALRSQSAECRMYMLSRTAHLPQVHPDEFLPYPPPLVRPGDRVRQIVRKLRAEARKAQTQGIGWQAVIDAIRPTTDQIWQSLTLEDRLRFLRHLKTFWEIHRSRMPPAVHALMEGYRAEGSVEIIAGRLRQTRPAPEGLDLQIALRHAGPRELQVDRMINCTGVIEYYHDRPRPLIAALLQSGLASANSLGVGFQTDEHGALQGPASHILYTLGPPRRGDLLETFAVPEIRTQAEQLAAWLLNQPSAAKPSQFQTSTDSPQ